MENCHLPDPDDVQVQVVVGLPQHTGSWEYDGVEAESTLYPSRLTETRIHLPG